MGATLLRLILRTHYLNSKSVVVEVSETVGLALQNLHFGMESFGDSVVAGEAPHAGDFLPPGVKSMAELSAKVNRKDDVFTGSRSLTQRVDADTPRENARSTQACDRRHLHARSSNRGAGYHPHKSRAGF